VTRQEESSEAIDKEVQDLVRDLGGNIASQSFGFDKDDSIAFGFSDNEDGDSDKSSKQKARPNQDQTFNKMLTENLAPSFKSSNEDDKKSLTVTDGQVFASQEASLKNPEKDRHGEVQTFQNFTPHKTPDMPSFFETSKAEQSNSSSFVEKKGLKLSSDEQSIDDPESDFSDRFTPNFSPNPKTSFDDKSYDSKSFSPSCQPDFGGEGVRSQNVVSDQPTLFDAYEERIGHSSTEKPSTETRVVEDDEDLDLQLYLTDNSEEDESSDKETVENKVVENFIERLVESKKEVSPPLKSPNVQVQPEIRSPPPVVVVEQTERETKSPPREQQISTSASVVSEPFNYLLPKSSFELESFVDQHSIELADSRIVQPVHPDLDDGSDDSSEVEVHKCSNCGAEFRTIITLKIHRSACNKLEQKNSKKIPQTFFNKIDQTYANKTDQTFANKTDQTFTSKPDGKILPVKKVSTPKQSSLSSSTSSSDEDDQVKTIGLVLILKV